MKKLLFTLMILSFITACNDGKKEKSLENKSSRMDSIVAIHDELMPKMSTIGELQGKISAQLDSINPDSTKTAAIFQLKSANDNMMQWMKNFGSDFTFEEINKGETLSPEKEKLLTYYEKSVVELRQKMNAAIENAEAIVNNSDNK